MNDIHSLHAGIVSVNAGTNAMLKERFQRMCSQIRHGAGLNIGGQTGFNTNLLLGEKIHQRPIFNGFYAMSNTLRPQFTNRLPDAFRSGSFACMDGNMPARITRAVEMRKEQTSRETKFITG